MSGLGSAGRRRSIRCPIKGQIEGGESSTGTITTAATARRRRPRSASAPTCTCRCRKATGWRRRASPITPTSKSSPTSSSAGGGTTCIMRSTPSSSGAWVPQGPQTEWVPNSKSILFLEYGIPAVDKGTNQPNVFFDPSRRESCDALLVDLGPAPTSRAAICRCATTRSRRSRSRRSTNTGTSTATTRPSAACR